MQVASTDAQASGDGPVHALFAALTRATGIPLEIDSFQVSSVTVGDDAQGHRFADVDGPDKGRWVEMNGDDRGQAVGGCDGERAQLMRNHGAGAGMRVTVRVDSHVPRHDAGVRAERDGNAGMSGIAEHQHVANWNQPAQQDARQCQIKRDCSHRPGHLGFISHLLRQRHRYRRLVADFSFTLHRHVAT